MNILNEYCKKYGLVLFAIITLIITFIKTPFWDETHSFEIASCTLKEIFYLTRIEGHPVLWYLVLKPFTNIKFYPYSMYIVNWLFCFFSIYIFFKKAPFSYIVKGLIAFSTPFLLYFAPVARCYAIGIFFIFLICAYYPKRFKRPYLFSTLIVLASQTSLMAMIGVFYLGLIYLYELIIRYRKKILKRKILCNVIIIFLLASVFTLLEFTGLTTPDKKYTDDIIKGIISFVLLPYGVNIPSFILRLTSSIIFYTLPYILFKYSKKGLFFITSTYLTLILVFMFINAGSYWNYYFYYVYLIVLFWLFGKKILKIKFLKYIFYIFLLFMIAPYAVQNGTVLEFIYSSKSDIIAKHILKNPEYRKSKLYVLEWWNDISPGATIYLKRNGIKLYNKNNDEKGSFKDLREIFKLKNELIDFDDFILNAPKDFLILSDGNILNQKFKNCIFEKKENKDLIIKTENNKYFLHQIDNQIQNLNLIIYKVIKL